MLVELKEVLCQCERRGETLTSTYEQQTKSPPELAQLRLQSSFKAAKIPAMKSVVMEKRATFKAYINHSWVAERRACIHDNCLFSFAF